MIDIAKFESKYKEKIDNETRVSVPNLLKLRGKIVAKFDESDLQAVQQNFHDLRCTTDIEVRKTALGGLRVTQMGCRKFQMN